VPAKQRRNYGRVRASVSAIAQERIQILLSEARKSLDGNPTLSKRYTELAKKISMRTKVRIPSSEKRYICKGCGLPLIPGKNARVRILPGNPRIVITCLACGTLKRYPFSKNHV
jgi:ribonuclease P protein subunit RPR2